MAISVELLLQVLAEIDDDDDWNSRASPTPIGISQALLPSSGNRTNASRSAAAKLITQENTCELCPPFF